MNLSAEISDVVTPVFLVINLCLCIAVFFKGVRVIVRPYVVVMSMILMALDLYTGKWVFAVMFAFVGLLNLIGVISEQNSNENKYNDHSVSGTITQTVPAAVEVRPKVPTTKGTCPKCGDPLDLGRKNCAYCGVLLTTA